MSLKVGCHYQHGLERWPCHKCSAMLSPLILGRKYLCPLVSAALLRTVRIHKVVPCTRALLLFLQWAEIHVWCIPTSKSLNSNLLVTLLLVPFSSVLWLLQCLGALRTWLAWIYPHFGNYASWNDWWTLILELWTVRQLCRTVTTTCDDFIFLYLSSLFLL